MPHVVVFYTGNLDGPAPDGANMGELCRRLADALLTVRDEADKQVFPTGGVRVFAYPATHFAVADGSSAGPDGHGFVYVNLRMGRGRSPEVQKAAGAALSAAARDQFAPMLDRRRFGLTIQIDEGPEVFDAKLGNLHSDFQKG